MFFEGPGVVGRVVGVPGLPQDMRHAQLRQETPEEREARKARGELSKRGRMP